MKNNYLKGFIVGILLAIISIVIILKIATKSSFTDGEMISKNSFSNLVDKTNTIQDIEVSDYYLINYWATWCKPCVEEMPLLDKLVFPLQEKGIKVICISNEKDKQKAINFIKKKSLNNLKLYHQSVKNTTINTLPTTILIDKNFNVLWSKTGKLSENIKEEILKSIK